MLIIRAGKRSQISWKWWFILLVMCWIQVNNTNKTGKYLWFLICSAHLPLTVLISFHVWPNYSVSNRAYKHNIKMQYKPEKPRNFPCIALKMWHRCNVDGVLKSAHGWDEQRWHAAWLFSRDKEVKKLSLFSVTFHNEILGTLAAMATGAFVAHCGYWKQ